MIIEIGIRIQQLFIIVLQIIVNEYLDYLDLTILEMVDQAIDQDLQIMKTHIQKMDLMIMKNLILLDQLLIKK